MREQEKEYRRSVLPEYNTHERLVSIDGFVDKIREFDPKTKDELDRMYIEQGYKYEATVGYPESLGEQGNRTTFLYQGKPTVEDIRKDLLEEFCDFKRQVNEPVSYGIVAKSGRDENIERVIDRVLGKARHTCKVR